MASFMLTTNPASYWIRMHVMQLLKTLGCGKNVEVVVTRLPEGALSSSLGYRKLQCLQSNGKQTFARFSDQQMDMLRHHQLTVITSNS